MRIALLFFSILMLAPACKEHYTPRPRGYFRIDLPEKNYVKLDSIFPFCFNYPDYSQILPDNDSPNEANWINIHYPAFNATIHLSYKPVSGNIDNLMEDSRKLAYKHSIKADAIGESVFSNPQSHLFGILYEIKGNAASPLQFAVTDSVAHFLRGSLYFNTAPNKDSLAPVIDFIKLDMIELIESITWK